MCHPNTIGELKNEYNDGRFVFFLHKTMGHEHILHNYTYVPTIYTNIQIMYLYKQ